MACWLVKGMDLLNCPLLDRLKIELSSEVTNYVNQLRIFYRPMPWSQTKQGLLKESIKLSRKHDIP